MLLTWMAPWRLPCRELFIIAAAARIREEEITEPEGVLQ